MKIVKVLLGLLLGMGVLVITLIGLLIFVDPNAFREQLERGASEAFERPITIDGPMTLSRSLHPKLVVEGLVVGNPEWATGPYLAKVDRLQVKVGLLSLLVGDLAVDMVTFDGVDVRLETDGGGNGNFLSQDPDTPFVLPNIERFNIREAEISYKPHGEAKRRAAIQEAQVEQGPGGQRAFLFEGAVDDMPLQMSGKIVRPVAGKDSHPLWSIQATIKAVDTVLEVHGQIPNPTALATGDYQFRLKGDRLDRLNTLFDWSLPKNTPVDLKGEFHSSLDEGAGKWQFQLDAAGERVQLKLKGKSARPYAMAGMDVTFDLKGKQLNALTALFGHDLDLQGGYKLAGRLSEKGKKGKNKQRPWAIDAAFTMPDMTFSLVGHTRHPGIPEDGNYRFELKGKPELLTAITGIELPAGDSHQLSGQLDASVDKGKGRWQLDLSVTAEDMKLQAKGSTAHPFDTNGLDVKVNIEGEKVESLLPLIHLTFPLHGAYQGSVELVERKEHYQFDELKLRVGETLIGGKIAIYHKQLRKRIVAELTANELHLADMELLSSDSKQDAEGNAGKRVIPDYTFPVDLLAQADMDFSLRVDRIMTKLGELGKLNLKASLQDRVFQIDPFEVTGWDGGEITASLLFDANQDPPRITQKLHAKNMNYGSLLAKTGVTDLVKGLVDLDLSLQGVGRNRSEFLGQSKGHFILTSGAGEFASRKLDLWGSDLATVMFESDERKGDVTQINCVVARIAIEDGLARSDDILVDTQKMTLAVAGTLNLATEEIELVLKPALKKTSLFSVANPARITGSLASPKVSQTSLPKERLAVIGGSALAGLVNPAFLLLSFSKLGLSEDNPCESAVQEADAASKNIGLEVE